MPVLDVSHDCRMLGTLNPISTVVGAAVVVAAVSAALAAAWSP